MCLECLTSKPHPHHKHKKSDKTDQEGDILTCYEKAGDLALLYLQVNFGMLTKWIGLAAYTKL